MQRYIEEVDRLIAAGEAERAVLQGHISAYEKLKEFLESAPKTTTIGGQRVPVGRKAFLLGRLVHTNEVLVSLGDNWFVDRSAAQAGAIAQRRIEYVSESLKERDASLTQLRLRKDIILNKDDTVVAEKLRSLNAGAGGGNVDADGDVVNEDGDKFVDIHEDVDDLGNVVFDEKVLQQTSKHPLPQSQKQSSNATPTSKPTSKNSLGDFERNFLAKLSQLEQEEDANAISNEEPEVDTDEVENKDKEEDEDDGEDEDELIDDEIPIMKANIATATNSSAMASKSISEPVSISATSNSNSTSTKESDKLGSFERKLLAKLSRLEKEEDTNGIMADVEDELEVGGEELEEDEYEKGLQEFSSGIREDDDHDDFNDPDAPIKKGESDDEEEESLDEEEADDDEDRKIRKSLLQQKEKERMSSYRQQPPKSHLNSKPTSGSLPSDSATSNMVASQSHSLHTFPVIKTPADIYLHMKSVSDAAAAATTLKTSKNESLTSKPTAPTTTSSSSTSAPTSAPASATSNNKSHVVSKATAPTGSEKENPDIPPETQIFLKDKITDRFFTSDDDDYESVASEDLEDYLFGREIAKEYYEKRAIMLAQQEKIREKMGDQVLEQLDIREEDRTGSVFSSQRIGFPSADMEREIREYVENQKREEALAREEASLSTSSAAEPNFAAAVAYASAPVKSNPTAIQPSSIPATATTTSISKPRFKPTLKPKKSVSFSDEALEQAASQEAAEEASKHKYNFSGMGSVSVPTKEVEQEKPKVSKFKASRQEAATTTSPIVAKVNEQEPAKVSKFKAARQESTAATVSGPNAVAASTTPAPQQSTESVIPKVSQFRADQQQAATPSVPTQPSVTPAIVSTNPPTETPRVSKFKASRQIAAATGASVPQGIAAPIKEKEVVKPVQDTIREKPSSFKSQVPEKKPVPAASVVGNASVAAKHQTQTPKEKEEVFVQHRPVSEVVFERVVPRQEPVRSLDEEEVEEKPKKKSLFRQRLE
ncbi:hypothetical protein HDU99_003801 [Rhizoclosmatium hyalinum]|nr:hypothetical protein HDU99_003801 [Rhizoclosmatium hyalinum]